MSNDYEIKELLEITTTLLVEAKIPDREFHENLIICQRKVLKRFLNKNERKEIENMIDLKAKAKELGIEPNVTGFEEEMRIEYLDGKREGKIEGEINFARKLLEIGVDEDIISQGTNIPIERIKRNLSILFLKFFF